MNPDLFIVVGGPAGLATAIVAARSGLSDVVSDIAYPPIDRACGEGLLPDALEALSHLASVSGALLFTRSYSVMLSSRCPFPLEHNLPWHPGQTPLLRLSMIETRNPLDMFSEKGTANAPPGPRLPI